MEKKQARGIIVTLDENGKDLITLESFYEDGPYTEAEIARMARADRCDERADSILLVCPVTASVKKSAISQLQRAKLLNEAESELDFDCFREEESGLVYGVSTYIRNLLGSMQGSMAYGMASPC